MRIVLGEALANEAAANVVLAGPEKQQAHASGHHVVELDGVGGSVAHPSQCFHDRSAVRSGRASGVGNDDEK